jgi:hypothetical protein
LKGYNSLLFEQRQRQRYFRLEARNLASLHARDRENLLRAPTDQILPILERDDD